MGGLERVLGESSADLNQGRYWMWGGGHPSLSSSASAAGAPASRHRGRGSGGPLALQVASGFIRKCPANQPFLCSECFEESTADHSLSGEGAS